MAGGPKTERGRRYHRGREEGLPIRPVVERLRGLSPPLRYLAYVVGALLAFLVATGVGAAAAFVVGGYPESATSGSGSPAGSGTTEGATVETTEGTVIETTGEAANASPPEASSVQNTDEPTGKITFTHTATDANSRGDYTYIGDPSIDDDPNAVVLVAPTPDRGSASASASTATAGTRAYGRNIGVWYEGADKKKWAIFNQDRAAVPAGTTFEVVIPPASESFVHRAEPDNTFGDTTYLDDPLTNGRPGISVSVTQNWNPGGGGGVYNDHPVGVLYDEDEERWAVYNLDGAGLPKGAAFNVAVSKGAESTR